MLGNANIYAYATTILMWYGGTEVVIYKDLDGEPIVTTNRNSDYNNDENVLLKGTPLLLCYRTNKFRTSKSRTKEINVEGLLRHYVLRLIEDEEDEYTK